MPAVEAPLTVAQVERLLTRRLQAVAEEEAADAAPRLSRGQQHAALWVAIARVAWPKGDEAEAIQEVFDAIASAVDGAIADHQQALEDAVRQAQLWGTPVEFACTIDLIAARDAALLALGFKPSEN